MYQTEGGWGEAIPFFFLKCTDTIITALLFKERVSSEFLTEYLLPNRRKRTLIHAFTIILSLIQLPRTIYIHDLYTCIVV